MRLLLAQLLILLTSQVEARHHKHALKHYIVPAENTRVKLDVRGYQVKPRLRRHRAERVILDMPTTASLEHLPATRGFDARLKDLDIDKDFLLVALDLQPQLSAASLRPAQSSAPIVMRPGNPAPTLLIQPSSRTIKWVPAESRSYFVPTQRGQTVPSKALEGVVLQAAWDAAAKGRFDNLLEEDEDVV